MDAKQLGTWFRRARIEAGFLTTDLAKLLDVPAAKIQALEEGIPGAPLDFARRIARQLGCEVPSQSLRIAHSRHFILKSKDRPLLGFTLLSFVSGLMEVRKDTVEETHRHLLPMDLECTPHGLYSWLQRRLMPRHRTYFEAILYGLQRSAADLSGLIRDTHLLSLNDCFWIDTVNSGLKFSQVSLYQNEWDLMLSENALFGSHHLCPYGCLSAEPTTQGMLAKAWIRNDRGQIQLCKRGIFGFSNGGFEPYSEEMASQLAQAMGVDAVKYWLDCYGGELVSCCPLFTSESISFVSIGFLHPGKSLDEIIAWYSAHGPDYAQALADMFIFDALIVNEDRHFGNFGLLYDAQTNMLSGPAPLFDHGFSFLALAAKDLWKDDSAVLRYAQARLNAQQEDFFERAKAVITPRQKEQLKSLAGFHFDASRLPGLQAERMQGIEQLVDLRRRRLLELPCCEQSLLS